MDHGADLGPPYRAARAILAWAAERWPDLQARAGWDNPLELMPAWRGFDFLYDSLTAGLSAEARLQVDAILGDEAAQAELERRRYDSVMAAGFEVG